MTDSCYVFPPGERVTDDSTGAPVLGGTVEFYDAGTTNPKTVYADADLLVPLGTSVVTDSLGYPTSNGTARTLIYVGTARYKIVIKDADDVEIVTHDDIPGAVVSASSVDVAVTALFPVITKSLPYTVTADDQNTLIKVNCSSADVTITALSAVEAGDGFRFGMQHAGSANQALMATVSSQLISEGSKSFSTQYALSLNGEEVWFTSDGGNWNVSSHTSPFIKIAQGIIPITDRLSAPPVSPVQGALYLLTSSPSGVWSGFAQHDIVQYHGGSTAWVNFTPPSNCGWRAYVQDESLYYSYVSSAWASEYATTASPGTTVLATQAQLEAETAGAFVTTAAAQKFHPGHPKVWGKADIAGSISASYNMTSVTDAGTGEIGLTIATDFSGANYALLATILDTSPGSDIGPGVVTAQAAGTATVRNYFASNASRRDPTGYFWTGLGDQ